MLSVFLNCPNFLSLLSIYMPYLTLIFYCICDIVGPLLMKTGSVFLSEPAQVFSVFVLE